MAPTRPEMSLSPCLVVERALAVAHGETVESYSAYNILSNNCEHFASWARCGWSISCQVAHRGGQLVKLAMLAGAAVLPRPVSVLGNVDDSQYNCDVSPSVRWSLSCWSPHGRRHAQECRTGG